MQGFSQSSIEKIAYYVYALKNPYDNKIFYIGKGKGNRIFQHVKGVIKGENQDSLKIKIIKNILSKNGEPEHIIIRHGLGEKEAYEVESALIDFYGFDNLSNKVLGHHSGERGIMKIEDIKIIYESSSVDIIDTVMLININRNFYFGMLMEEIYQSTKGSWRVDIKNARKCKYVFSVYKGITRGVFCINSWQKEHGIDNNRYEFSGEIPSKEVLERYLYKDVSKYWTQGSQNPIKYVNIK